MSAANTLLPLLGRSVLADSAALSALVRDSVATGTPRQVLLVRLGPVARRLRAGHHHRLVRETLEPLLRPSRARLFALPNGDLAAVGPERGWHMESVARDLATLLGEEAARPACALLRLPGQAAVVLAAMEDALAAEEALPVAAAAVPVRHAVTRPDRDPAPAPARLARAIAAASIAAFLRCRPVFRVDPGAEEPIPLPQWTEWRIDLPGLHAAVLGEAGEAEEAATPWLRGVLEQRLLAELAEPEDAARRGPVGFALGIAAIDSAVFRRLEGMTAPAVRAESVIALPAEAALADPLGFRAARDVLAGRGWRLALDCAEAGAAALLPPARTGIDLVRLRFDPAVATAGLPRGLAPERVVLTGVDRGAALGWGMEAGIRLFEGRLLAR